MSKKQKNKKTKKQANSGFTLLEMVVAIALFAIITLIVVDIFLTATQAHRRTMETQKLQSDARFAMETMAREARMDTIDYNYSGYSGGVIVSPTETLALKDIDGNKLVFKKSDTGDESSKCPDETSRPCLLVGDGQAINWQSITPAGVQVVKLNFYIEPKEDPFLLDSAPPSPTWQYSYNVQPRVTIVFVSRTIYPPAGELAPEVVYLQTTITSRMYKR